MTLRLAHSGPGIPGAVRPGSHVTRLRGRGIYDQEQDVDGFRAATALAAIAAMHRSTVLADLITAAKTHNPAVAHLLTGWAEASATIDAAARTGRVVTLSDDQTVIDRRHPSAQDDCPPLGIKRPRT